MRMATALRPRAPLTGDDGLVASFTRLAHLELELGLAETRQTLLTAALVVAVGLVAAIALIAAVVVLLAAALAPLFAARGQHLLIAGGAVALGALAALAWCVTRLRRLDWPHQTLESLEETWRWLAAQLRSKLTLR